MEKHNKKIIGFNIIEVIVIIIISGITASVATGIITMSNARTSSGIAYDELLKDEKVKNFLDVYADVVNGYYEDVDKDKIMDSAISGMMNYLGDKYTTYLNDSQTDSLNNSLAGTYNGIGVSVSEGAIIESIFDDSPAEKAGMQKGDKIVAVDGEDVRNKEVADIVTIIQAKKGNTKFTVVRDNKLMDITVDVGDVNKPAISYSTVDKDNKKIGYLYIQKFSTTVTSQVKSALKKMEDENIEGLIIDLRNNGGGYLSAASDITSMFLEKGKTIYSLENKDETKAYNDETDEKKNYNIVVIVNQETASAAEVMAAALKDSYGAKIVGKTTFGKGKVQQTKTLSDGTMVKYTTAKWLRPNGECLDGIGLSPDYEIAIEINDDGQATDSQYEKALEVIFE